MKSTKRTRIEPSLLQCSNCKKKFFSFINIMLCPECIEKGKVETVTFHKTSAVGPSEITSTLLLYEDQNIVDEISRKRVAMMRESRNE